MMCASNRRRNDVANGAAICSMRAKSTVSKENKEIKSGRRNESVFKAHFCRSVISEIETFGAVCWTDTAENDKVTLVIPPDSQSSREHLMSSAVSHPRGCVPNEKSNSWMPVVVNKKGVLPAGRYQSLKQICEVSNAH